MKKNSSLYWICQISGWFSYGLTILFFASILDKELNPIFYPRLLLNLSLGILITHVLRESMHRLSLRPPMPSNQWWKLVLLLLVFSIKFLKLRTLFLQGELNGPAHLSTLECPASKTM